MYKRDYWTGFGKKREILRNIKKEELK